MSEEIALAAADRPLLAQQADEIDQLRRALAEALAELDRNQPIVIAAARLAAGPDAAAWEALYAALNGGL